MPSNKPSKVSSGKQLSELRQVPSVSSSNIVFQSSKHSKEQQSSAHPSSFLQSKINSDRNSKHQYSPEFQTLLSKTQVSSYRFKGNYDQSRTRNTSPFKN